MNEAEFDQLLAGWGERTRLRESEAAATLPSFAAFPGPLPGAEDACVAPWLGFWDCIDQMLRCVTQIGPNIAQRCLPAARWNGR